MLRVKYKVNNKALGEFDELWDQELLERAALSPNVCGSNGQHWSVRAKPLNHGHHVALDENFNAFLEVDQEVPTAPVWVRDLAGRVIHTGLGRDDRQIDDWQAYFNDSAENAAENAVERNVPYIVFPRGCSAAPKQMLEMIEGTFKTKFRTLDASFLMAAVPDVDSPGEIDTPTIYAAPNVFPYKLRMDTFYQDGWRLPQVQMVFAKKVDNQDMAKSLGERLLADWQGRPAGEQYSAFIGRQGQGWGDNLFELGCTLIPTFEATNGVILVGKDYEVEDYWPGRAVPGLHEIAEVRADTSPAGTILEVLKPGFVTAVDIVAAVVVVSDGSNYVSPHLEAPVAMVPNLNLPHTRCSAEWGRVWIPTHPRHFAEPALWGWEMETGRFVQMSGPLWDPLHYYYACNDRVVTCFETALEGNLNERLVAVPEDMQERFFPVVAMDGFDTLSLPLLESRLMRGSLLHTSVKMLRGPSITNGKEIAGVGYHPLPLEFEYELEPFWMPEMHPRVRVTDDCPDDLKDTICPVITPNVSGEAYKATVEIDGSNAEQMAGFVRPIWLKENAPVAETSKDVLYNYPFLARYLSDEFLLEDIALVAELPVLLPPTRDVVLGNMLRVWPQQDERGDVDPVTDGLFEELWKIRARGFDFATLRYQVYMEHTLAYVLAWWNGTKGVDMLESVMLVTLENTQDFLKERGIVPAYEATNNMAVPVPVVGEEAAPATIIDELKAK